MQANLLKIHAVPVTTTRKRVNRLVLLHAVILAKPLKIHAVVVLIQVRLVLQRALIRVTIIRVQQKFFQEHYVAVLMIVHKNARTAALVKVSHRLVVLWTRQPKILVGHVPPHPKLLKTLAGRAA